MLETLRGIDADRAQAIAKLAEEVENKLQKRKPVEIVKMAPRIGLIVVTDSPALRSMEGVTLIEIAPARHLITLKNGLTTDSFEIKLQDRLEEKKDTPQDSLLLRELLDLIRQQRRMKAVSKEEFLLINI